MNALKTTILLATLTALFIWIGHALGGQAGMIYGLIFAGLMNFGTYWFSDKIVLALHGAKELKESEAPKLYEMVRYLCSRGQLPMPKLYIVQGPPNAFATGRNPSHAAVAVTDSLLEALKPEELQGVLAHELTHIKHRDTLIMTVAATIAGALSMVARMAMWGMGGHRSNDREGSNPLVGLIALIVAPIAAMLIQMAISRTREYMADEGGATMTSNPMGLANALMQLESWKMRSPIRDGNQALAHLYIVNPFKMEGLASLFRTHPLTKDRVKRLEDLAGRPRP